MAVKQVLVGFYDIPKSVEQPLQLVINPEVPLRQTLLRASCNTVIQCVASAWDTPEKLFTKLASDVLFTTVCTEPK